MVLQENAGSADENEGCARKEAISDSLSRTRKKSRKRTSPVASARMITVELCDPQFPAVSITMGKKETSSGSARKASS